MRIAHFTTTPVPGGVQRMVETACRAHAAAGHDVAVSSVRRVAAPHRRAIRHRVDGNRPTATLAWALLRTLAFRADVAVVHAGSPTECALPAMVLSRLLPTVLLEHSFHHPLASPGEERLYAMKRRVPNWMAVSRACADRVAANAGVDATRIGVLHNGAPRPVNEADDTELPSGPMVLGVGRPTADKGFDRFCNLADTIEGAGFVWVGGDKARRVGSVDLRPWREKLGPFYDAAAVVVLPYRVEGFLVLYEAMACARPVVCRRVGGFDEMIEDGVDGRLVAGDDPRSWTAAVAGLLGSASERERLGQAALRRWRRDFSLEAYGRRLHELLETVASSR
ncbi:MAG: glycosyltransferase family 4 protein [Thermoleophilia bacterium]|nr:glycosyltransferase family 4 protein [Thermoleophilia bacterium]